MWRLRLQEEHTTKTTITTTLPKTIMAVAVTTIAAIYSSHENDFRVLGGRRDRLESWGGMSDLPAGMRDLKGDQNLDSLGVGIFTGASTNTNSMY